MVESIVAGPRHVSGALPAAAAKFFPDGGLVGEPGTRRAKAALVLCAGHSWTR